MTKDTDPPARPDAFIVSYNLESPYTSDSMVNILMILFILLTMIVFALVLSNAVSDLALKPMERILAMVRTIAESVFKTSQNMKEKQKKEGVEIVDDDSEFSESGDIGNVSEMQLLEKIVEKLGISSMSL